MLRHPEGARTSGDGRAILEHLKSRRELTIEVWVTLTELDGPPVPKFRLFALQMGEGGGETGAPNGLAVLTDAGDLPGVGRPVQIIEVVDAGGWARLYLNGAPVETAPPPGREGAARIRWDDAAIFVIRLMGQGPPAVDGRLVAVFHRVAVYDRAMSAAEVARLYRVNALAFSDGSVIY
jgi:hypothetical protein